MEIIENVKVLNRLGLHLRAAAQFVRASSRFKCSVWVRHNQGYADGKSLLNLMELPSSYGSELTLVFRGEDAQEARESLRTLFTTVWRKGIGLKPKKPDN